MISVSNLIVITIIFCFYQWYSIQKLDYHESIIDTFNSNKKYPTIYSIKNTGLINVNIYSDYFNDKNCSLLKTYEMKPIFSHSSNRLFVNTNIYHIFYHIYLNKIMNKRNETYHVITINESKNPVLIKQRFFSIDNNEIISLLFITNLISIVLLIVLLPILLFYLYFEILYFYY